MDQEKIGVFISTLRKEQGMTQQQLADAIGVSNKTISKWECGKGMPELALIVPLCHILQISINEFLSGEHLLENGYTEKAEVNMMNLLQETENSKKKSRSSLLAFGITVIIFLFSISNSFNISIVTLYWLSRSGLDASNTWRIKSEYFISSRVDLKASTNFVGSFDTNPTVSEIINSIPFGSIALLEFGSRVAKSISFTKTSFESDNFNLFKIVDFPALV